MKAECVQVLLGSCHHSANSSEWLSDKCDIFSLGDYKAIWAQGCEHPSLLKNLLDTALAAWPVNSKVTCNKRSQEPSSVLFLWNELADLSPNTTFFFLPQKQSSSNRTRQNETKHTHTQIKGGIIFQVMILRPFVCFCFKCSTDEGRSLFLATLAS